MKIDWHFISAFLLGVVVTWFFLVARRQQDETPPDDEHKYADWRRPVKKTA